MPTPRLPALVLSLAMAACATGPAPAPDAPALDKGYDLRLEDGKISLSLRRDLPLPEFLQLCQQVTQEIYTYRADELAERGPIHFLGKIACDEAHFGEFVQTMLYVHGLRIEPTQTEGVKQVVPMEPARRS